MKVLYICGTYAPGAFAGSELSAHELLRMLQNEHGVQVRVVTDEKFTGGKPAALTYHDVMVRGIRHEERHDCIATILDEYRPDVVLTQLMWSDVAVQAARSRNIPSVLRISSVAEHLDLVSPTALVGNSRFICDWVERKSGRKCHYVTSVIDLDRVRSTGSSQRPRYVTMFNPIREKGGHVFRKIAELMANTEFAVVPGWHSLRNEDGTWDQRVMRASLESQRATDMEWEPEDVDLSGMDNVRQLQPREDVSEIYAVTRILLVPSQYQETLGRVSIEAMANGIPVVASKVGGVQEQVGRAGILISDYASASAWVEAIETLNDPETYAHYSRKGLEFVEKEFSNRKTASDFLRLCTSLAQTPRES